MSQRMLRSLVRFARWPAILLLSCALLACDSTAAPDKVHVEFWTMSLKPKFTAYFNTLLASYQAAHPGVALEWVDVPGTMQTS